MNISFVSQMNAAFYKGNAMFFFVFKKAT